MEINAKDLRIGNLVFADLYDETPILVESICSKNQDIFNSTTGEIPLTSIKGIPITEQLLLEFGFVKHSTNPFWFRNKQLCVSLAYAVELISWDMQIFKIDTTVKYAHQLQNLYFALTNQELIKQ